MLGKGNLSFERALFNLKEFTPINLHIFPIAPLVAFFFSFSFLFCELITDC